MPGKDPFVRSLTLGMGVPIAAVLAIAANALVAAHLLRQSSDELIEQRIPDLLAVSDIALLVEHRASEGRAYLLTGEPRYHASMEETGARLSAALDRLEERGRPEPFASLLAQVRSAEQAYQAALEREHARGGVAAGRSPPEVLALIRPYRERLEATLAALTSYEQGWVADAAARRNRAMERIALLQLAFVLVGAAASIAVGLSVARRMRRLHESERLVSARLEMVLSVVAHDLRNPLGVVELAAQRLERTGDPAVVRDAGRIRRAGMRMEELIASLLDASKAKSGRLTGTLGAVDLAATLRAVAELFAEPARRQGATIVVGAAPPLLALADRERVEQVLSNLVGNALKYAGPRPRVTLEAWATDEEVGVTVRDDGPGIPEELRARVFDPFAQATEDEHRTGLGLGLYIARRIVEEHGGRIWIEDAAGGGTAVNLTLPSRPIEPEAAARPPAAPEDERRPPA